MSKTWTGAFGQACGVLLQAIVNGLALTRISPNVLTFVGLLINSAAAILFGLANQQNYVRMFLYAGLVIVGAGIFDMVDGRVARQTQQVTVFGAFFDSVIDRYSDVVLFFGLLVFYARGNRLFYVFLAAFVMITSCCGACMPVLENPGPLLSSAWRQPLLQRRASSRSWPPS